MGAPDARAALAARLWAESGPADSTPGRAYLAARFAWPPAGIGPDLPATVRWLASGAVAPEPAAKWRDLPAGAVGALVFAWRSAETVTQDRPLHELPPRHELARCHRAVSLLAVAAAGERVTWFGERAVRVCTVGSRTGAAFEARAGEGAGELHVCEGELDALALSLAPWCGPGRIVAAGGTSGMRRAGEIASGPVVLHCDGDPGGRGAVERARHAIAEAGRAVRVEWYPVGTDPADALAELVRERAAIREHDGGEARDDADRGAWAELV